MINSKDGYIKIDGNKKDLLLDYLAITTAIKDILSQDLPRDAAIAILHAVVDEEIEEEDKTMIDMTGLNKVFCELNPEE